MEVLDDDSSRIQYSGDWVKRGVLRDFDSTVHATCAPGSSLSFTFNGTNISVFGTILNDTQSTSLYSIDGDRRRIFTTPQVSQDMHRALFFTQRNLRNREHTLTVSFVNSTTPPSDGASCFSFDFLMYLDTSNTFLSSSPGDQGNATSSDQADSGIPNNVPRLATPTSQNTSLIIGVSLAVFFALQLVVIFVLLRWHRRGLAATLHTPKDAESHTSSTPSSTSVSPVSPPEAVVATPFVQSPTRPPTISTTLATVYSSDDGRSPQRGQASTLPPYPPSKDTNRARSNPRLVSGRGVADVRSPLSRESLVREAESEITLPPSYA